MIGEKLSVVDKFKLLKDLGYDGVEIGTRQKIDKKEVARAREVTGLPVHGVINASNPDIKVAVDLSKAYGGTSVLPNPVPTIRVSTNPGVPVVSSMSVLPGVATPVTSR